MLGDPVVSGDNSASSDDDDEGSVELDREKDASLYFANWIVMTTDWNMIEALPCGTLMPPGLYPQCCILQMYNLKLIECCELVSSVCDTL